MLDIYLQKHKVARKVMKKSLIIFMFSLVPWTFAQGIDVREDTTVFGSREAEYGPKEDSITFSLFSGGYFNGLNQNFPTTASPFANFTNYWRYGVRIGYSVLKNLEVAGHLAYTPTVDNNINLNVYDFGGSVIGNIPLYKQIYAYATLGVGAIRYREVAIFDFTRFNLSYGAGLKFFPFKNLAIAPEFLAMTIFDPSKTAFSPTLNIVYYWNFKKKAPDQDRDGIPDAIDKCPTKPETKNGYQDKDGCPDKIENDRDGDGILDSQDKCPDQPETVNGFEDEDGCPDVGDRDKDGLMDDKDQCPDQPETVNGYLDDDGCPENPQDLDGDGILNESDKCPKEPETKNGFMDEDGCPEDPNDIDRDGIPNDKDKCPKEPETVNGYMDDDGCPENPQDIDGDGILNELDKCPREPENYNNFEDTDGCPDKVPNDSDNDGVTDDKDKCPGQKEIYNGYMDEDGCPDHELDEFSGVIEGIYFEINQAMIKRRSYPKLNKAAEVLGRYPILNFVIEGHTDSTGSDAYNMTLSEQRAQSVYEYLSYRGIKKNRMSIEAYGESKPIATNKTSQGRAKNRRIEFRVLNLEQAKQVAEELKSRAR